MFTTLFQIAKNTFRESLREPIYLLILLSALILILIYPVFTLFVFFGQEKLVIDSSMATMMVFGWGLAIMISSYAISREIDNGTALLLMSKPVQRPVFIIAKILGILAATTLFSFITGVASLLSLRVATDQFWIDNFFLYGNFVVILIALAIAGAYNYVTRSSFCSAAIIALTCLLPIMAIIGHFKPADGHHVGLAFRTIPALLLITFSVGSMGTLATALSTRFGLVPNLLLCAAIFMLGLMSDYLIGRNAKEKWYRTPPAGEEQLWMDSYEFSPTELAAIESWGEPRRINENDPEGDFIVWTDTMESAGELPDLGPEPFSSWKDGNGWRHNLKDLKSSAIRMGIYDAHKQTWAYHYIGEAAEAHREAGKNYTSFIFRRAGNPPRTPVGGTYLDPLPDTGNYIASALYAAIPNWQLFWMADALSSRGDMADVNTKEPTVPGIYVAYGAIYALVMNVLLSLLAILLFWNRETGVQMTF
ncbi:MAG: ABC transporter permease [Victivallales bacterium]|nr:ABC transporter permease [Victivallales bacterium]